MAGNSSIDLLDDVLPPGFRFHPTDEELVLYYLKRKICRRRLKLDVIAEVDVYKCDPEELPGLSFLKTGDRQWFFFCPRDRKYPNGSRSNRATRRGYWKATGKDRTITCNSRTVGVKKTLVFYKGRAPNGERTDWVMHEYTLADEELMRCPNANDSYALYKLFKKSGPGPKNGEQYGAPFREELWVDDGDNPITTDNIGTVDQENHAPLVNNTEFVDDDGVFAQVYPLSSGIEEFLNQAIVQPIAQQASIDDYANTLSQFTGEEESRSTMVDPSFGDPIYTKPSTFYTSVSQQYKLQSQSQWCNAPELTSVPKVSIAQCQVSEVTSATTARDLHHHVAEDDFLEMNDLLGPEPSPDKGDLVPNSTIESLPENPKLPEVVDRWCDWDLYYDAEMFLRELDPIGQATAPNPSQESNPVTAPGDVYTGVSNQTQMFKDDNDRSQPWLTSALWSFVETIPTKPAAAADSDLVNKVLERVSSFSKVRINTKNAIPVPKTGIKGGRMKGFFLLSFLVALFAVVCVLIGSNASALGKWHCRMKL